MLKCDGGSLTSTLMCVCVCVNSLTEKSKGPAVLYTQEHNFNFNSVPLLSTWYGDDNQPACPPFYCTAKSITLPRSPVISLPHRKPERQEETLMSGSYGWRMHLSIIIFSF